MQASVCVYSPLSSENAYRVCANSCLIFKKLLFSYFTPILFIACLLYTEGVQCPLPASLFVTYLIFILEYHRDFRLHSLTYTPLGQHSSALSGSCTVPGSLAILVDCLWITPAMDGVLALLLLSFCALTAVFLHDFGGSSREQWCVCVMLFKLMYLKSIIWDKSFQVYWLESLCLISALDKHFCLIVQENL